MTQNLLECAVRSLDKHLARDITAIDVTAVSPIATTLFLPAAAARRR